MMTGYFGFREPGAKRVTEDVLWVHLEQIEDLDTELIVKIAVARVGHVVDKYEPISLSLYTGGGGGGMKTGFNVERAEKTVS